MREVPLGGGIRVGVGEEFAVSRADYRSSGYVTRVVPPSGVRHLGTDVRPSFGFGGAATALERFSCDAAGRHRIEFVEGRPWEEATTTSHVTVDCR